MATLKTIRKRITSVRNTQKITKAMKMVSAAKLRRAQSALVQARPHAELLKHSVNRLVSQADAWDHPLIAPRDEPKKAEIMVMSSDRGLCGGFNSNLLRKVDLFVRHDGRIYEEVRISVLGRKGRDYYRAKKISLKEEMTWRPEFNFAHAQQMAQEWSEKFKNGEFDVFYLAFNHFKSAISQDPMMQQILPLELKPEEGEVGEAPVLWEGKPLEIIDSLLPRYVATMIFLGVLESQASELGARMSAMENATNNAKDMIYSLTLQYNRARQASITKELMDIVNGAEALK